MRAIANGEITNKVEIQNILTEYNQTILAGTSQDTKAYLADIPDSQAGHTVLGNANETKEDHIFLNQNHSQDYVEIIHHENAHQNDQGESTAHLIGKANNAVAGLGSWANSKDIANEYSNIENNPVTVVKGINDKQTQEDLIKTNTALLEEQKTEGDVFEDSRRGRVINQTQQLRRDIITLETVKIRRHLPSFNGIPSYRSSNNQIRESEIVEYQAFSRFLQSSTKTYPDFHTAYREFRRKRANPPINPLSNANRITRGDHAVLRSKEGRPISNAIRDLSNARNSDIYIQNDGRYIVRGPRGREHIIKKNGVVITSLVRSKKAHLARTDRRKADQSEVEWIKKFVQQK